MFSIKPLSFISLTVTIFAYITYIKYSDYFSPQTVPFLFPLNNFTYKTPYVYNFSQALSEYQRIFFLKYSRDPDLNVVPRLKNVNLTDFAAIYDSKWPVIVNVPVENVVDMARLEKIYEAYPDDPIIVTVVEGSLGNASAVSMTVSAFSDALRWPTSDTHWVYAGDEWFLTNHPHVAVNLSFVTRLLGEDLFRSFPRELRPWGPMLLWGSAYSRSFLHIDPYNWTGVNVVLKGHKKWKLFPPGQDSRLSVTPGKRCGFPLDCIKYNSIIDAFDSRFSDSLTSLRVIEVDQYPGDALVIPTGWFHQAYNAEETVAVASQAMNLQNYRVVLEEVIKGGNVKRDWLETDLEGKTITEQVQAVLAVIPESVLDRARELRWQISRQIQTGGR